MKLFSIFLTVLAVAPPLPAQPPSQSGHGIEFLPGTLKAPVGKAMTDEEILEQRKAAKFGGFKPEGSESRDWDLNAHSDFIGVDGNLVILPRGSVIHVPEARAVNILSVPEGKIMSWIDFVVRYRALVQPFDVTMKEVSGEAPVSAAKLDAAKRTGRIIVAVLSHNPVTLVNAEGKAP